MERLSFAIVGSGNVAGHLSRGLAAKGHIPLQVISRNPVTGGELARDLDVLWTSIPADLDPKADLVLICVPDGQISPVAAALPATDALVVHTSGSTPLAVLQSFFPLCGVLYPVQSFSRSREINLSQVPFCTEASNDAATEQLTRLALELSNHVTPLSSAQRFLVHLAAVLANNFTNQLYSQAAQLLHSQGLSFDLLRPLILETALKVQHNSPADMQTGPALRGDQETMNKHLVLLQTNPELQKIYEALSALIGK